MSRFHEAEAAVFHKRDAVIGELDLERERVPARTEQDGDLGKTHALVSQSLYFSSHECRLLALVERLDEKRTRSALSFGEQAFSKRLGHLDHERIRYVENGLRAAIVLFEGHDLRIGEAVFEIEEVAVVRPPERVDALSIVPDNHHVV